MEKLHLKKTRRQVVVDWLIILGIILVFAAIAIPDFQKFQNKRTKTTEAKVVLGWIYTAQLAYKSNHGVFAGGPDAFSMLNLYTELSFAYSYFCGDDYLPNTIRDPVADDVPQMFGVHAASSATGFTCLAIGNYDQDSDLDVWSINDAKVLQLIHDDTK